MGKVVRFTVVDATGAVAAGQTILAGDVELTTTSQGVAQALMDDGNTVIKVNGVKAYEGAVEALKSVETFTTSGQRQA